LLNWPFGRLRISNMPSNYSTDYQKPKIQNQMGDPYVIGLAVAGWLATTWLAYRWGLRSQKMQQEHAAKSAIKDRRREFLVFMKAWRGDFERPRYGYNSESAHPTIFIEGLIPWHGYVALICDDFKGVDRAKFDELVAIIPKCHVHDQKQILKAMNDVIAYVETAK
jgi:hypothetical protein